MKLKNLLLVIVLISLISLSSLTFAASCPKGTAYADGCSGASSGTAQLPNLLDFQKVTALNILGGSGYTNGTYSWTSTGGGCSVAATGTVTVTAGAVGGSYGGSYTISNEGSGCTSRPTIAIPGGAGAGTGGSIIATVYQGVPPWNVAGVDYAVGVPSGTTLSDPTAGGLPSGCTYASSFVTCTGANFNLTGWDFTLHNTNLNINASGNCTIANNKFVPNAAVNGLWIVRVSSSNTCNLTFQNNSIDGLSPIGTSGGSGFTMNPTWILDSGGSGDIIMLYNYCHNMDSKCTQISGNTGRTKTYTEKYNLFYAYGNCATPPCAHGEAEYTFSPAGATIVLNEEFNTYYVPFHNSPEDLTALQAIQGDTVTLANGSIDHNVNLAQGPQATCPAVGSPNATAYSASANFYDGFQTGGGLNNTTFSYNYMDGSGVFFNWYHTNGTGLIFQNNRDAGANGLCNQTSKTPPTTPVASPATGSYAGTQTVSLSNPSSAPVICYNTTTSPVTNQATGCAVGTVYTGPISVPASETLYWVAGGTGIDDSIQASATYTIAANVATPTFSPTGGTYSAATPVTISTTTSGATLCYTTDGSTPTANGAGVCTHGTTYSSAVIVSFSQTLMAVGSKSGDTDSSVGTAVYTIALLCAMPPYTTNQSCFYSSTSTTGLSNPIPSWGPNPTPSGANGSDPYHVQLTGNLTGANTVVTPLPWGLPVTRCTDTNSYGTALNIFWGMSDNGQPNLFAADDSAMVLKENGGTRVFMHFDANGNCTPITGLTITGGLNVNFGHSIASPNTFYTLGDANTTELDKYTLTYTCSGLPLTCVDAGTLATRQVMYDFAGGSIAGSLTSGTFQLGEVIKQGTTNATSDYLANTSSLMQIGIVSGTPDGNVLHTWVGQTSGAVWAPTAVPLAEACLQNAYNGDTTWAGGGSVGLLTSTQDDTSFSIYFSETGVGAQHGVWLATYTTAYALGSGCDLWQTSTQKYRTHGGTQGLISILPPSHALDKVRIHEGYSSLSPTYSILATDSINQYLYGTFTGGQGWYIWTTATPTVTLCGYPPNGTVFDGHVPNPLNGNTVWGAVTSGTFSSTETVIQQSTGATATLIATVTINNQMQIGAITVAAADGTHDWVGQTSGAHYTPIANYIIGAVNSGTFSPGETLTQTGTFATAKFAGNIVGSTDPLMIGVVSGSANGTGTWTGATSGAIYTPIASTPTTDSLGVPQLNPTSATGNYNCDGHWANGFTSGIAGKNGLQHNWAGGTPPQTPGFYPFPNVTATPNGAPCGDSHWSWNHDNATDSYPPIVTEEDYFDTVNLSLVQSGFCPYFDEVYGGNLGMTGSIVPRFAPEVNSGWSWSFDVQNGGVAIQAQSGKWLMYLTDGWGQFGSTAGNASCNIGGPDWQKGVQAWPNGGGYTTSTGYGSMIMPQAGGNGNNYVYHVQSCAGTCTSGSTEPSFPQPSLATPWTASTTVVDGNITWELARDSNNSALNAISNCRAEVMLVRLFNGVSALPVAPSAVIFADAEAAREFDALIKFALQGAE